MPQIGGKPIVSKTAKTPKKKSSSSTTKRHFTVVIGSKEHGLYVSSSPSSAARKAVSKLCATDKKRKVQFHIREITQGSKKKTYGSYLGYIEKLAKPIELKGRVIKYKPVAKLSGKTGKKNTVKKGGMRGGDKKIYIGTNIDDENLPYYKLDTDKDLTGIDPSNLTFLRDSIRFVDMKNTTSNDRKIIRFRFCNLMMLKSLINSNKDPSSFYKEKLMRYLKNPNDHSIISNGLKKLNIEDVKIKLCIPYINDTDQITYEEYDVNIPRNGNNGNNGNGNNGNGHPISKIHSQMEEVN